MVLSTCRGMKVIPYKPPCTKLKSKRIEDLNINPTTMNPIQQNVGSSLECINAGEYILNITPVAQMLRTAINKLKLRSFCKTRHSQQDIMAALRMRKNLHQPHIRGLISKIYKRTQETKDQNTKESN